MGQEEAAPLPVTVVVVASWEQAVKHAVEDRDLPPPPPESPKKTKAPTRQLSVPPPPGRPSSMPGPKSSFSRGRAVRPEDDPFLAAYLACTTNSATGGGGKRNGRGPAARPEPNNKGLRRLTWAGLGLSCKGSSAAVEQSMVKLAKRPEMDPRDA
ncbi:hypothetical protein PR202_gb24409 [Eleusine coracana subsp. coracana]|uniref:Uncharacterized protein n=1 Tax=Eleusine coracana subsp. coracana TaxID=191504 RepID=A0AAV5FLE7_ELECO|nr:hypothetical protein QOZ80_5BG0448150 [Eleusine coracana subsp. coracana]GJN35615.1 hypothetical protein PR202_gb24409 [Eleusine coracana subsp. coracana]